MDLLTIFVFLLHIQTCADAYVRRPQKNHYPNCHERCRRHGLMCDLRTFGCKRFPDNSRPASLSPTCPPGEIPRNGRCVCPPHAPVRRPSGICAKRANICGELDNVDTNGDECECVEGFVMDPECNGRLGRHCDGCSECAELKPNTVSDGENGCECIHGFTPAAGWTERNSVGCEKVNPCASAVCPSGMYCVGMQGGMNCFGNHQQPTSQQSAHHGQMNQGMQQPMSSMHYNPFGSMSTDYGSLYDGSNPGTDVDSTLGFGGGNPNANGGANDNGATGNTGFGGAGAGNGNNFGNSDGFGGGAGASNNFGGNNGFGAGNGGASINTGFGPGTGTNFGGGQNTGISGGAGAGQEPMIHGQTGICQGDHFCACMTGKYDPQTHTCGTQTPTHCDCPEGIPCVKDQLAVGGYRCACPKYGRYNYETYKCDCLFRHHGPFCQCKRTSWWDKRYKACRGVTKAVFRKCQFNLKCMKIKHSYCQALGPKEAGCTCDSGYILKVKREVLNQMDLRADPFTKPRVKVWKACIRDFQNTTMFTRVVGDMKATALTDKISKEQSLIRA